MNKFTLTFDIKPMAWARARANHKTGAFFTSKEMRAYQTALKIEARKQMIANKIPALTGILQLHIYFNYERPSKTILKAPKPDLDNLVKNVGDSFNEIVFKDDSQIAILYAQKRWADKDSIHITIEEF